MSFDGVAWLLCAWGMDTVSISLLNLIFTHVTHLIPLLGLDLILAHVTHLIPLLGLVGLTATICTTG